MNVGNGLRPLVWVVALAYPGLVYCAVTTGNTRAVGGFLLAILALRFAVQRTGTSASWLELLKRLGPVGALIAIGTLIDDPRALLALPVLVNASLLVAFAISLATDTTTVERIARLEDPDLSADEVRYCRIVTCVWCAFFAANGGIAAALALHGPVHLWALYTGIISYGLMVLLFAAEYGIRRLRFGRFTDSRIDRWLQRRLSNDFDADWTRVRERGNELGVRIIVFLSILAGRTTVRAAMRLVAAYYLVTDEKLRRASRTFYEHLGVESTWLTTYRHIRCFAYCASDRIFLLRGQHALFEISRTGQEHAIRVAREGRGGILIGAHLGSFEALHAAATADGLAISGVAYVKNAAKFNAVIENLDPQFANRMIVIEPGRIGHMLQIRERIRAGELVAFLGDRVLPGADAIDVDFLGESALFSTGALSVAAALGCPVLLIFNLYRDPNRYELHCEPFVERVDRATLGDLSATRALVQRYADRLAHYARRAPDNWANFYDFWDPPT